MDQMESMVRIRDEKSREAAGILFREASLCDRTGCGRSQGHEGAFVQNIRKEQRGAVHAGAPELIGGFVLQTGDVEYDYSLSGQLRRMFEGNR